MFMKPFQVIILITLIGCSRESNTEPEGPHVIQPVDDKSNWLSFGEMTPDAEMFSDEITGFDEFDFEPPIVKTANKPLSSFDLQEMKTVRTEVMSQLNCEDLNIEYLGANDKKLMYKAVCDGITYLIDYDLKSVQVVKVIKR